MDLTQLANLGEFIGGVAVLLTLIYLAAQVRQGNRLARAQVRQETARVSSELAAQADSESMGLFIRARSDFDSLSEVEKGVAGMHFVATANYYETLFYARARGDVDNDLWESRVIRMKGVIAGSGEHIWHKWKYGFGSKFQDFVDNEILPDAYSGPLNFPGDHS